MNRVWGYIGFAAYGRPAARRGHGDARGARPPPFYGRGRGSPSARFARSSRAAISACAVCRNSGISSAAPAINAGYARSSEHP